MHFEIGGIMKKKFVFVSVQKTEKKNIAETMYFLPSFFEEVFCSANRFVGSNVFFVRFALFSFIFVLFVLRVFFYA